MSSIHNFHLLTNSGVFLGLFCIFVCCFYFIILFFKFKNITLEVILYYRLQICRFTIICLLMRINRTERETDFHYLDRVTTTYNDAH